MSEPQRYYFKLLSEDRLAFYDGTQWPPIGKWTARRPNPRVCSSGWHVYPNGKDCYPWFQNREQGVGVYIAEIRGNTRCARDGTKLAAEQARLTHFLGIYRGRWDGFRSRDSDWYGWLSERVRLV